MPRYDFDLITIGAGSGGVRASRLAGGLGARVAIVEERRVGGTCVLRGCVPKKLLLYGAQFADAFEDAAGFGWTPGAPTFDWPTLIARKNAELDRLEGIYARILRDNGVTTIAGRGRLIDAHTVAVDGKTYSAERILIAVGGRPALPAIPGIEHAITSDDALDLPALPGRIVIVGGGFIAVEFAGIFARLGVDVRLVVRAGNILRGFDEDVRETLAEEMERRGVRIARETLVRSIERKTDGALSIRLAGSGVDGGEEWAADAILYATGRSPNTHGLGLEEVGVAMNDKGAIVVDEGNQTSVSGVFAVGDVTDRINLTPVAIREGAAFAQTHFNARPTVVDYADVPSAVFSMPPVGTVGLTEAEARRDGRTIDVYVTRFRPMRNTLSGRGERTMMKLIVDRKTDKVLGAHMVGTDAPEIIQGLAIAIKAGATKADFDATVGIHPTAAEEFVTLRDPIPDPTPDGSE